MDSGTFWGYLCGLITSNIWSHIWRIDVRQANVMVAQRRAVAQHRGVSGLFYFLSEALWSIRASLGYLERHVTWHGCMLHLLLRHSCLSQCQKKNKIIQDDFITAVPVWPFSVLSSIFPLIFNKTEWQKMAKWIIYIQFDTETGENDWWKVCVCSPGMCCSSE